MNFFNASRGLAVLLSSILLGASPFASAVSMSTYVMTPSQWGTGSAFYHGHTVSASTPFNVLNAGGAFTVQCNHPATLPMTGERAFGSNTWGIDPNIVIVTIPAQLPALRNVSGWLQIPGGTYLSCNYRWTAFATEGGYSLSISPISITYGNESVRDGGTVDFMIYRPPHEDADGGCTP